MSIARYCLRKRAVATALALGLALAVAVIVCVLINLIVQPPVLREDMPGPYFVYGAYDPEISPDGVTYRWTTDHATLTFPYAAHLGSILRVRIRLAGNRTAGQKPAEVTISLNAKPQQHIVAANGFEVYTATIDASNVPDPYLNPAHLQVDIESSAVSVAGDPRQLGVAVDWVEVTPARSGIEIISETLAWTLGLLVVMGIAASRLGGRWAAAYAGLLLATLIIVHLTYLPRAIPPIIEIGLAVLAWTSAALFAPRTRPIWGVGLAMLALWMLVAGRILGDWQMDDAYISYRYAWNLVHGSGLVYNPGEIVEGYTNFLWTVIAAMALWAGWQPALVSLALTIACSQALVGLAFFLGRRLAGSKAPGGWAWALLGAAFVAVDSSLVTYGARGSGIEAALFAFLIILGTALLWEPGERAVVFHVLGGFALGLAALTRPEGLLVAVLAIGIRAWQEHWARKPLLAMALPCLALIVPYQVWRITFYGYLFPNTFYAKTGTTLTQVARGLDYAWQFAIDHWLLVLVLLFALVALPVTLLGDFAHRRRAASETSARAIDEIAEKKSNSANNGLRLFLGLLTIVYSLYVIAVGGDWFPGQRFFVPIVVPVALLATEFIRLVIEGKGKGTSIARRAQLRGPALALASVLVIFYIGSALWLQRSDGELAQRTLKETYIVENWSAAGVWLRTSTPAQTIIAVEAAGAIAYYSRRYAIDGFGLNDLHIARLQVDNMGAGLAGHEKKDPAYVLDKKPEYILAFWEGYFKPVADRLNAEYEHIRQRSPTGQEFEWLKRKDTGSR